jgi:uncharacterized HAD superfamily protein
MASNHIRGRLCIDIDNVIAQTDEIMRRVIHDFTGGRVKLDYTHIDEFDYYRCVDAHNCFITKEEWVHIHDLFSEPRYLWLIPPVQGVQEHLYRLSTVFDIHLATSRLPKARRTTIEWLENYGFPPHDLHFLKHGEKHASLGKFVAAVEDHYEQAVELAKSGIPCYLLEHPWNHGKPAVEKVYWAKDWSKLTEQLLALIPIE